MSRALLSIGDPNGIGPEIAVLAAKSAGAPAAPVLVGDRFVVRKAASAAGMSVRDYDRHSPGVPDVVDVIDVPHLPPAEHRPGRLSAAAGAATIAYVRAAIELARSGGFHAVLAGPHSETAVHAAGIAFRGYPPLVAELTGVPADRAFLLLLGGGLRIVHATLHERLADALDRLSPELVSAAGLALHEALLTLGVAQPRLGVFGINPHAGEGGLFGTEDQSVTEVAAAAMRERGLTVHGPLGADVLLAAETAQRCDGFVAMYHDQGHMPVKLLAGKTSSALTIGAGVPFCSVGHGTAFDIAGTGRADPTALISSLALFQPAAQVAR